VIQRIPPYATSLRTSQASVAQTRRRMLAPDDQQSYHPGAQPATAFCREASARTEAVVLARFLRAVGDPATFPGFPDARSRRPWRIGSSRRSPSGPRSQRRRRSSDGSARAVSFKVPAQVASAWRMRSVSVSRGVRQSPLNPKTAGGCLWAPAPWSRSCATPARARSHTCRSLVVVGDRPMMGNWFWRLGSCPLRSTSAQTRWSSAARVFWTKSPAMVAHRSGVPGVPAAERCNGAVPRRVRLASLRAGSPRTGAPRR
jgi:hypothetical protein